jgi:hypothetical protein
MLRYGFEIYQQLIKMFVRTNKRFPNEKENKFLQNQALRVREGLFDRGVNMEELSAEDAIKVFSQPPRRRKRPTAEIYKPLEFGKKSKPKEGIETLPEADVIDFPVKPKPPEGEPYKDGGPVDKKDEDTVPLDPNEFDEMFKKMFSEWEWEKKKDSWKDKDYADGGLATLFEERG